MIPVTPDIALQDDELEIRAVRAQGPGGQHVNKTSTAVELRFDARRSPSLPNMVSVRLQKLAGSRLTLDGVIVLVAQDHRSQVLNREAAVGRLLEMIRAASLVPKRRKATKPTKASKERHLAAKKGRSTVKAGRSKPGLDH
jgi:ribosome-associated protein